jgi:hypothetical protein
MGLGKEGKNIIVLPVDAVETGIELVRGLLKHVWIDERKCARLIKGLFKYHYELDENKNVYSKKPVHDEHSNPADMMRYLATYLATKKHAASKVSPYEPRLNPYVPQMGAHGWMG